jgi:hypothetical protein
MNIFVQVADRGNFSKVAREKPRNQHYGILSQIAFSDSLDPNRTLLWDLPEFRPPAPKTALSKVDVPPYAVDGLRPEHQLNQRRSLT